MRDTKTIGHVCVPGHACDVIGNDADVRRGGKGYVARCDCGEEFSADNIHDLEGACREHWSTVLEREDASL